MKKIGFIDYYLDEWHANNYPQFIKNVSDEFEVTIAYAKIDSPIGGMTSEEWSKKYNIPLASSIEEVIEKSDFLVVLSPDNPEMHEELSDLALKSSKPVYMDKAFAPDSETAKRMFEKAKKYNTPLCSSSALNFAKEIHEVKKEGIELIRCMSMGEFKTHIIHEVEPVVVMMNERAQKVMYVGSDNIGSAIIKFPSNRTAELTMANRDFEFDIIYKENEDIITVPIKSAFFEEFIKAMLKFFETKTPFVSSEQTIRVIEIVEAIFKGMENPCTWIDIK